MIYMQKGRLTDPSTVEQGEFQEFETEAEAWAFLLGCKTGEFVCIADLPKVPAVFTFELRIGPS